MSVRMELTPAEDALARYVGEERQKYHNSSSTKDKQMNRRSPTEIAINGMAGEIAVAKMLNVYPDVTIGFGDFNALAWDLTTAKGTRIDVKTSFEDYHDLYVLLDKPKDYCDVFIQVYGCNPVFEIYGFAYAKDVMLPENIGNKGYGDIYIYPKSRLTRFKERRFL